MDAVVYVLDTTAFLARWPLYAPRGRLVAPRSVEEEVRDDWSREGLRLAVELGRVEILEPSPASRRRSREAAAEAGLLQRLSRADLDVAALALDMSSGGARVVVVTDDYALQNLAALLGLEYMSLRTRGIARVRRRYTPRCPRCGYALGPWDTECPRCGYVLGDR